MAKTKAPPPDSPIEEIDAPIQAPEGAFAYGPARPGKAKLPEPPGRMLSPAQFFDYIKKLTEDDWAHCTCYVYRSYPIIVRGADESKYIDKASLGFTEDDIKHRYGSGDYYFTLNDQNIRGTQQTVCSVPRSRPYVLRDPEFPPNVPLEKVALSDPANASYKKELIDRGKLNAQGEPVTIVAQQGNDPQMWNMMQTLLKQIMEQPKKPEGADAAVFTRAMEMLQQAGKASTEMVLSQVQRDDPDKLVKLMAAMKELAAPASSDGNTLLVKMLMDSQKAQSDLMMKLIEAKSQPPADSTANLKGTVETFQTLKEVFGGDGARPGKLDWAERIAPLVEPLGSIAYNVTSMILNRGQGRPAGPSATITRVPHIADAPGVLPAPNPAQPPPDAAVQQLAAFLPPFVNPIVNFINMNRTGAEFADFVTDGYGEIVYQQIRQLSKEQVLQAMSMTDGLAPLVQQVPERMAQFVDEFLHPEIIEGEPAEEEAEAKVN